MKTPLIININVNYHSEEFNSHEFNNYNNLQFENLNELELLGLYLLSEISERKFYELMEVKYNIETAKKTNKLLNNTINGLIEFKK